MVLFACRVAASSNKRIELTKISLALHFGSSSSTFGNLNFKDNNMMRIFIIILMLLIPVNAVSGVVERPSRNYEDYAIYCYGWMASIKSYQFDVENCLLNFDFSQIWEAE